MHLILFAIGVLMVIIGVVLIRYGVPLDEYGNSPLLMSGMVALTGGLILIALSAAVRGINRIAERLDIQPLPVPPIQKIEVGTPRRLPPTPLIPPKPAPEGGAPDPQTEPVAAPEPRVEPETAPAGPKIPPKTSLLGGLFGRSKQSPAAPPAPREEPKPEPPPPAEPPPPSVDLGPLTEVIAPEAVSPPPAATPPNGGEKPPDFPKSVEPSGAAVYKSGVIDGMAYTLYVDGSIEAELEHGRVRFATVEDLQKYLLKK